MNNKLPLFLFLAAELILYALILYQDFHTAAFLGEISDFTGRILRYSSVLLALFFENFLFTFFRNLLNPSASKKLAALTFTALADYFLLFSHAYRTGVFLFCFVQLIYLHCSGEKESPRLTALFPPLYFPSLYALSSAYLLLSLSNLLRILKHLIRSPRPAEKQQKLFAWGLLLLLLCDIEVGLSFLFSHMPAVFGRAGRFASCSIWLFYLPSLLCIVFSSLTFDKKQ